MDYIAAFESSLLAKSEAGALEHLEHDFASSQDTDNTHPVPFAHASRLLAGLEYMVNRYAGKCLSDTQIWMSFLGTSGDQHLTQTVDKY